MKMEDKDFLEEVLQALKESENLEHLQNRSLIERAIAKVEFRLEQALESSEFVEFSERSNSGRNKIGNIDGHSYFVPVVAGVEYSHVAETPDMALLLGLGIKYDGVNSQFARMAARMLAIPTVWAK